MEKNAIIYPLQVGRAKPIPVSSARTGRAAHTGIGRDVFHPPATGSATTSRHFSPHSGARWQHGVPVGAYRATGQLSVTRIAVELSTIPSATGTNPHRRCI